MPSFCPGPLKGTQPISAVWNFAENYFDWGGNVYRLSLKDGKLESSTLNMHPEKSKSSLAAKILKIITLPIAGLIFFAIRTIYRRKYDIAIINKKHADSTVTKTHDKSSSILKTDEQNDDTVSNTNNEILKIDEPNETKPKEVNIVFAYKSLEANTEMPLDFKKELPSGNYVIGIHHDSRFDFHQPAKKIKELTKEHSNWNLINFRFARHDIELNGANKKIHATAELKIPNHANIKPEFNEYTFYWDRRTEPDGHVNTPLTQQETTAVNAFNAKTLQMIINDAK